MPKNPLTDFFRRAGFKGWSSQSSALNPLTWAILILLAGLVWLDTHQGSPLLEVFLSFLLAVALGYYGYEHHHLIRHNPDALRSDRVVITKYAIERGLVGDNKTGIIEIDPDEIEPVKENRSSKKS